QWPTHRIPQIGKLRVNSMLAEESVKLKANQTYNATIDIESADKNLSFRWEIMKEVDRAVESDGGDFEPTPEIIWHFPGNVASKQIEFEAPTKGEYRLFVYIDDSHGGTATANMPILVESTGTHSAA
ncbi:MAG: hypothetical protein ACPG5F_04680, partial [Porticoccaceae bacterium]